MKVYSKKRLISGVLCLTVIVVSLITKIILIRNGDINVIKEIKSIVIGALGVIGSLGMIFTSLNEKSNREAEIEENDERNQLINLHINKRVNKIMFYLYWIGVIVFVLIWSINKNDLVLIPVIVLGFLITINIVSTIIASIYYEKKL